MRFPFRGVLLSLVTAVAAAGPLQACLNDREVARAEREFKSQYTDQATPEPVSPGETPAGQPWRNPVATGLGAAMLVGAAYLLFARPRA